MNLPKYDKSKRRMSFEQLPKGAYVVVIKDAREEANRSGVGTHLSIAFDIAEGEHASIYSKMFKANTNEDKKWPNDGVYYLMVPDRDSKEYIWTNWNTFFADLEDSNNGFVFEGDPKSLRGKLLGGKFAIEQTEYNGLIYDHTKLKWTCVAEDVRNGKAGKMPADKLIEHVRASSPAPQTDDSDFMNLPDGVEDDFPF